MIATLIGAWLDVRSKPLRTVAAIAGMIAAVVAVILVDAAGVLSREANDIYLARTYGLPITMMISPETGTARSVDDRRLESTLRENGITLSPSVSVGGTVTWDGAYIAGGIRWLSPEFRDIRVVDLVAGEWPEVTARSDVLHAVVTEGWASETLGLSDQDVIGKTLGFAGYRAQFDALTTPVYPIVVDAVVSTGTNAFMPGEAPVSVVTSSTHPLLLENVLGMSWIARVNPHDMGLFMGLVDSVTDDSGQPIYRTNRADQYDQLAPVLDQQSVTASVVSAVALTIGGLGILGVGLASVRERARDFGLQRALGAGRGRIFAGVVVQALLEVLLAAAIAILVTAVLLEVFARDLVLATLPLPPSTALPVGSALKGVTAALLVGLAASLIPAYSAARASVIRALRG